MILISLGIQLVLMICCIYVIVSYKPEKGLKKIFAYTLIVGILSGISSTYLGSLFYKVDLGSYFFAIGLYTSLFMAGYILAMHTKLPLLWSNSIISKPMQLAIAIVMGCSLGGLLILIQGASIPITDQPTEAWVNLISTLKNSKSPLIYAVLTAFQAGFTEETLLRFFLIPLIVFILGKNTKLKFKHQVFIALIISALLFGVPATHNFYLAFIAGLVMGGLYLKLGFIPVVIIHIVGDIFSLGNLVR